MVQLVLYNVIVDTSMYQIGRLSALLERLPDLGGRVLVADCVLAQDDVRRAALQHRMPVDDRLRLKSASRVHEQSELFDDRPNVLLFPHLLVRHRVQQVGTADQP